MRIVKLGPGDVLRESDKYLSTIGVLVPCPVPGATIAEGNTTEWYRELDEPDLYDDLLSFGFEGEGEDKTMAIWNDGSRAIIVFRYFAKDHRQVYHWSIKDSNGNYFAAHERYENIEEYLPGAIREIVIYHLDYIS